MAKVVLGVRSFPIPTKIANVALRINMGLSHTDRILRQEMKNLVLSVFISLFLRIVNLSLKYSSKALTLMNLIY